MNKSVQILVAFTCVIVVICAGIWLIGQNEQRQEAQRRRDAAQMVAQFEREAWVSAQRAKSQALVDACKTDLEAYDDRGNTFAFVQRTIAAGEPLTGETMLAEVAKCRDIISSSAVEHKIAP